MPRPAVQMRKAKAHASVEPQSEDCQQQVAVCWFGEPAASRGEHWGSVAEGWDAGGQPSL